MVSSILNLTNAINGRYDEKDYPNIPCHPYGKNEFMETASSFKAIQGWLNIVKNNWGNRNWQKQVIELVTLSDHYCILFWSWHDGSGSCLFWDKKNPEPICTEVWSTYFVISRNINAICHIYNGLTITDRHSSEMYLYV